MDALWLRKEGNTRAVILFHAYTGTPADVRMLAQFLHRHDYAVYVPVFSGHGTPDVDDILNNSPKKWYEDAKKAIEFVKNSGFKTIAAFGLSMGGIMATKAATEQLVDYAGTFCSPISVRNPQLPGLLKSFMMYAQASYLKLNRPFDSIEMKLKAQKQLDELQIFSSEVASNLDKVTGSFYIAQGEQDTLVNPEASLELKEALVNAQVELHWYEEAGHVITVSPVRMEFQETVLSFLNQQEWR